MAKNPTALPTYLEQIVQGIPESPSNNKQMEKSSFPFTSNRRFGIAEGHNLPHINWPLGKVTTVSPGTRQPGQNGSDKDPTK